MNVELPSATKKRLASRVRAVGVRQAAREIGCNQGTLARALAGLRIQYATAALIEQKVQAEQ